MSQQNQSVHWGLYPPQKQHPLFLAKRPPPYIGKLSKPPLFRQFLPLYWFSVKPPLKVRFLSEPQKY